MARPREIKHKIATIRNTHKITKTMELVATVRSAQNQNRLKASLPYAEAAEDIGKLWREARRYRHPLLRQPKDPQAVALVVVTANRGLCGAYNTQVLAVAETRLREIERDRLKAEVFLIGKKAIVRFRFLNRPSVWQTAEFGDRPSWEQSCELAQVLMEYFTEGRVDAVEVVSTRFYSPGNEEAAVTRLLPFPPGPEQQETELLEEGPAEDITGELCTGVMRAGLYRLLLEAASAEQFARRIAMRAATDNAEEMIKQYERAYYRTRQSSITRELMDIIGGANALSEQG